MKILRAHLLASISAAGLLVTTAHAADMPYPVKAPAAPAAAPAYMWTGCYVGAGGGGGMLQSKDQTVAMVGGAPFDHPIDNGGHGWFGTVQGGCDYQVASQWVVGAFADYDFGSLKSHTAFGITAAHYSGDEKMKRSWAAGGRLGWLPNDRLMTYVSAGYSQAHFERTDYTSVGLGGVPLFFTDAHTYKGWFVGAGYEYDLGWLPGLTWKTEYRFADYGKDRLTGVDIATGHPTGVDVEREKFVHTLRSELVWRFNAPRAADLAARPIVKAAPRPATAWTGCYVGAGGGVGIWHSEDQTIDTPTGTPAGMPMDNGGRGAFATVQGGCDYQVGASWVIGAFADYDFASLKSNASLAIGPLEVGGEEKMSSSWAAGGRLGWLPVDRLMTYVSAGYSQAHFNRTDYTIFLTPLPSYSTDAHTYSGWFLGTGYEYDLGWVPGLTWKTEYRLADYGKDTLPLLSYPSGAPVPAAVERDKLVQTVRSALVWRFNTR